MWRMTTKQRFEAMIAAFVVVACSAASPAGADSSTLSWTKLHPTDNPHLFLGAFAGMASDGNGVVFHGGDLDADQTWRWHDGNWRRLDVDVTPGPIPDQLMAYDRARDRVVFIAPDAGTFEWNGHKWLGPPATFDAAVDRTRPAIAHDATRAVTVMFGGLMPQGPSDETWEWDGDSWHQVPAPTSPPARTGATLAYDDLRQQLLLFGGTGIGGAEFSDTWLFDGTTWTELKPTRHPSARTLHAAAYDADRGRILLFGGSHGGQPVGDTWEWTGGNWRRVRLTTHPEARAAHEMAWDEQYRRIIVFGGQGRTGPRADTWSLDD